MAAPTVYAVGTVASGTGDIVPGLPASPAVDDIFLMVVECDRGDSQATPSGWTPHPSNPSQTSTTGTGPCRLYLYAKIAVGGESDPTVSGAGLDHHIARIIGIRGADISGGSVWDFLSVAASLSQAGSGTAVSMPGVTSAHNDCLVLYAVANGSDTNTTQFSAWADANLASFAEIINNNTQAGGGGGIGVAGGTLATAGATGTATATLASASKHAWFVLAIKPTTAVNGTATPDTVAGVGGVPAPAASGAGTGSPGAVAGMGAVPAPTGRGAATASPSVVAGVGAVPSPSVSGGTMATPATVAGIGAVPAPSPRGDGTAASPVVAGVGAVPSPTARGNTTASPATVNGVAAVPMPIASGNGAATATPATVAGRATIPAPVVTGGISVVPVQGQAKAGSRLADTPHHGTRNRGDATAWTRSPGG